MSAAFVGGKRGDTISTDFIGDLKSGTNSRFLCVCEWTPLQAGRERIQVEEIAINVGKSESEARRISEEARESNLLSSVFSAPASVCA